MNNVKLNANALGITLGIILGLLIAIVTLLNLWWGYANSFTNILQDIYSFGSSNFGYSVSYMGAFIGLVFGFIDGYVLGLLTALLYNRLNK